MSVRVDPNNSLDGFVATTDQTLERTIGEDGTWPPQARNCGEPSTRSTVISSTTRSGFGRGGR